MKSCNGAPKLEIKTVEKNTVVMKSCNGPPKLERKIVEKNRRMHMKSLLFKISSLIPKDHNFSQDTPTQQDYLDQTAEYIKHMKEKIQRLKQRKAMGMDNQEKSSGIKLPIVELRHHDSSLEVLLISKHSEWFMFHEVISVLEEEGVEVINANYSVVGDKIFYTIHCLDLCSEVGLDATNILARLRDLIARHLQDEENYQMTCNL